jgi:hypothetical protein
VVSSKSINDPRWVLVARVADSPLFQKSSRLREFLFYICERSMQGRQDELREQRIGQDVFGRGIDFRPNEDNIVRVEARQLRRRLEEYFASEGKSEPVVITIPKGAYIACFESREQDPNNAATSGTVADGDAVTSAVGAPGTTGRTMLWLSILLGTTVFFALLSLWLAVRQQSAVHAQDAASHASVASDPLWSEVFNAEHQTYVVCADSALVLDEEITQRVLSLSDYVNRNYWSSASSLSGDLKGILKVLPQRQYTSISDVRLVQQVMQINHNFRDRCTVRSARNVQLIDFKSGNFVLFGSRMSTPWVELFEPMLDFRFVYDFASKRTGFRNVSPRAGEKSMYWIEGDPLQPTLTYEVIALVPNLSNNGNVLMIAGATGEGTEAAGEYITNSLHSNQILTSIHAIENGRVRHFEVLLKSGTIAGTSKNAEVVAYRLLDSAK